MGIKIIEKLAKEAEQNRKIEFQLHTEIAIRLRKITGIKELKVHYLPGDGICVCLEKNENDDSASLCDVLAYINKNGTITEKEIMNITYY